MENNENYVKIAIVFSDKLVLQSFMLSE